MYVMLSDLYLFLVSHMDGEDRSPPCKQRLWNVSMSQPEYNGN